MERIFVRTKAYTLIQTVASDCLNEKSFVLATGEPGCGKHYACSDFQQSNHNNVISIDFRASESPSDFLIKLIYALGVQKNRKRITLKALVKLAAENFVIKPYNMLLIIEHANKLTPRKYKCIHDLRNQTEANTGVLLIGTPHLIQKLESWNAADYSCYKKLRNRIQKEIKVPKPNKSEIISIIRQYGINDSDFEKRFQGLKDLRVLKDKIEDYERIIMNEGNEI